VGGFASSGRAMIVSCPLAVVIVIVVIVGQMLA